MPKCPRWNVNTRHTTDIWRPSAGLAAHDLDGLTPHGDPTNQSGKRGRSPSVFEQSHLGCAKIGMSFAALLADRLPANPARLLDPQNKDDHDDRRQILTDGILEFAAVQEMHKVVAGAAVRENAVKVARPCSVSHAFIFCITGNGDLLSFEDLPMRHR